MVSIVTLKAPDGTERFPAKSACFAVMLWVVSVNGVTTVKLHAPVASAVVVPKLVEVARKTSTIAFASTEPAAPMKVGVVSLVLLSVLDDPVSLAASKSGVAGATG